MRRAFSRPWAFVSKARDVIRSAEAQKKPPLRFDRRWHRVAFGGLVAGYAASVLTLGMLCLMPGSGPLWWIALMANLTGGACGIVLLGGGMIRSIKAKSIAERRPSDRRQIYRQNFT